MQHAFSVEKRATDTYRRWKNSNNNSNNKQQVTNRFHSYIAWHSKSNVNYMYANTFVLQHTVYGVQRTKWIISMKHYSNLNSVCCIWAERETVYVCALICPIPDWIYKNSKSSQTNRTTVLMLWCHAFRVACSVCSAQRSRALLNVSQAEYRVYTTGMYTTNAGE